MPSSNSDAAAPPRLLVAVAATLAVGLAAAVAVIGLTSGGEPEPAKPQARGEFALPAVPAPKAGSPACRKLEQALPDALPSAGLQLPRRRLAEPAPDAAAAWGEPEPVVLRCGLPKPPGLSSTSRLREVNGVRWLPESGDGSTTFYAVDGPVVVALTVPDGSGTGPLQTVSELVGELPQR